MIFKVTEIKDENDGGGYIEAIVMANDAEHACVLAKLYFNDLWGKEFDIDDFSAEFLGEEQGVLSFEVI